MENFDIKAYAEKNNLSIVRVIKENSIPAHEAIAQLSFLDLNSAYCQAKSTEDKRYCIYLYLTKLDNVSGVESAKEAYNNGMVPAIKREALNTWSDMLETKDDYKDFYVLNAKTNAPLCGVIAIQWFSLLKNIEDYIDYLSNIPCETPVWLNAYKAAVRLKPDGDPRDALFNLASNNVEAMKLALKKLY